MDERTDGCAGWLLYAVDPSYLLSPHPFIYLEQRRGTRGVGRHDHGPDPLEVVDVEGPHRLLLPLGCVFVCGVGGGGNCHMLDSMFVCVLGS